MPVRKIIRLGKLNIDFIAILGMKCLWYLVLYLAFDGFDCLKLDRITRVDYGVFSIELT